MEPPLNQGTLIDVRAIVDRNEEPWVNFDLTTVNDAIVRLGVVQGEFHWHRHDAEDELFLVLEGLLLLDLPDRTVELGPWQGWTVPRGQDHRTRADVPTVMLMVERRGVRPGGD